MAKPRVFKRKEVIEIELSPSARALWIVGDKVIVYHGHREATWFTEREAQILAAVVGETSEVDLSKLGSR